MSRKNEGKKPKAKGKENTAKKPVTGKTATGRNKSSSAGKTATGKTKSSGQATLPATRTTAKPKESNVGKVYRGRTKYIDKETKPERNYVVVLDDGKNVSVAKLKSIKIFDENNRNADKALVEINATRYGLEKRTGVDFERFSKNRMSKQALKLSDKRVFPEDKEEFVLSSKDKHNALVHTKAIADPKKKKRGK